MRQEQKHRGDFFLIGGLLVTGCLLGLFLFLTEQTGTQIQVRVAGSIVETFPLSQNRSYTIKGVDGGTNLLIIQDGQAWIEEASCPDGLCVHMGKIYRNGQSVVCLPNQVVVEVVANGNDANDEGTNVDFVAG